MADPRDQHDPPRLVGYESWLYQMPCVGSDGDVFISVPIEGAPDEPPNRWLIALGRFRGAGHALPASRRTWRPRWSGSSTPGVDPASLLEALNHGLMDLDWECTFATMVVAVIDSERHELLGGQRRVRPTTAAAVERACRGRHRRSVRLTPLGGAGADTLRTSRSRSDRATCSPLLGRRDGGHRSQGPPFRHELSETGDPPGSERCGVGRAVVLEAVRRFGGGRPQPDG